MAYRRRKVEVHRLTISGLPEKLGYRAFLQDVRGKVSELENAVWASGEKSHALHSLKAVNNRLRMTFMSFTTGYRPDILDTEKFEVEKNPLSDHQTGVEWTHILGGRVGGRFLLLVEKVQTGIFPTTLERYLQWMVDEHHEQNQVDTKDGDANDQDPVTISIEPEAGDEFIKRLDGLSRITKATVRKVRPNPGWADLDTSLAAEAIESDAHKAEVSMTARRRSTLSKKGGIVAAIKKLFGSNELDFAEIEGEKGKEKETFSTAKLVQKQSLSFKLDSQGQVDHADAWTKLASMMDSLK